MWPRRQDKEEKTAKLAECNAKFAGRRKPGGGYTYYDFMQDRTFDIAGPNPTPEEQKNRRAIYHLSRARAAQQHRRGAGGQAATAGSAADAGVAAGLAAHRTNPPPPVETEKVPVPVASPVKQAARIKAAQCAKDQFSCEWPRLSEKVNELKRLLNPQQQQQPAKQKKS